MPKPLVFVGTRLVEEYTQGFDFRKVGINDVTVDTEDCALGINNPCFIRFVDRETPELRISYMQHYPGSDGPEETLSTLSFNVANCGVWMFTHSYDEYIEEHSLVIHIFKLPEGFETLLRTNIPFYLTAKSCRLEATEGVTNDEGEPDACWVSGDLHFVSPGFYRAAFPVFTYDGGARDDVIGLMKNVRDQMEYFRLKNPIEPGTFVGYYVMDEGWHVGCIEYIGTDCDMNTCIQSLTQEDTFTTSMHRIFANFFYVTNGQFVVIDLKNKLMNRFIAIPAEFDRLKGQTVQVTKITVPCQTGEIYSALHKQFKIIKKNGENCDESKTKEYHGLTIRHNTASPEELEGRKHLVEILDKYHVIDKSRENNIVIIGISDNNAIDMMVNIPQILPYEGEEKDVNVGMWFASEDQSVIETSMTTFTHHKGEEE